MFQVDLSNLKKTTSRYLIVDVEKKTITGSNCQSMDKIDIPLKQNYPLEWLAKWIPECESDFNCLVPPYTWKNPENDPNDENSTHILAISELIDEDYKNCKKAGLI